MWNKIIIHHSLTKDGKVVDWQAIRRYHKSWAYCGEIVTEEEANQLILDGKRVKRPWVTIGYHFGIELINDEYEILTGRYLNQIGAHTRNHNEDALGICVVGNYDEEPPPEIVMQHLGKFIKSLIFAFPNITTDHVYGHRDFDNQKSCPGKLFNMELLKSKIK